jgi:hypothetical protein
LVDDPDLHRVIESYSNWGRDCWCLPGQSNTCGKRFDVEFDELSTNVPNTWYVFSNSKDGKVKFGALDKDNKTSIIGSRVPFSLKFSTIGNGLDILTLIKVSPTMDVSSSNGTQLGIKLNTTQIKLTGYNKF